MEAVSPHTALIKLIGQTEAVGYARMAAVECGIETGDLRKLGPFLVIARMGWRLCG